MEDGERLPKTDPEFVISCEDEYQAAVRGASSQETIDGALCRLIWAMAHSPYAHYHTRALEMARLQLGRGTGDVKEFRYLAAVACYRLGKYLEARKELTTLLESHPHFRQAQALKVWVDEGVVKDGLVGVGIAGAVAAVGLALVFGLMRKN